MFTPTEQYEEKVTKESIHEVQKLMKSRPAAESESVTAKDDFSLPIIVSKLAALLVRRFTDEISDSVPASGARGAVPKLRRLRAKKIEK